MDRKTKFKLAKLKSLIIKIWVFISLLLIVIIITIAGFFKELNTQPLGMLSTQTESFIRTTVTYFSLLSVITVILFSFAVFTFSIYIHEKRIILRQEKTNRLISQKAKISDRENKTKSKFLSDISHDIRTPINGIIGMTNIAINNIDNQNKVKDCLKKIDVSSSHLLCIINDILDMSRIENNKITVNNQPIDINTLLDKCNSIIEGALQNRNIEFIPEFNTFEYPYIKCDEQHILKIFINILGNAVKFTPNGGKIYFRVKENKKIDNIIYYRFEIEDTGIGMKKEFLDHIWDSFSQENNHSRTEYNGTGLGLAITKRLVELSNGHITVESMENIGSKFTVELPFELYDKNIETTQSNNINIKGLKILLVEDNELNMEIAKDILEDCGAIITTAKNGKIAVNKFYSSSINHFDLILMDIQMPIMDGLTATTAIRNLQRSDSKSIPIILMTASTYEEKIETAVKLGINAYLSKPLEINKFLKTIEGFNKN